MISTLEIGTAFSLVAAVIAYASFLASQPRPKPVPVRVRDAGQRRRPHA